MSSKLVSTILLASCLLGTAGRAQKQSPPEGGQPKDFVLPQKSVMSFDNGLQVTLVQYGLVPKVTVQAVLRTGNIDEAENEVWLADMTGDLMKEGTMTHSAEEIARMAAGMGGSVAISVSPDQTIVGASVLSEYGADLITLMADVIRNPRLPESELPRLKNDRIRDLSIALTDPGQLALARFNQVLYPNHPYGRFFPTEAMLKGYALNQIKAFYDQHFGAGRTHIYVAGKFDQAAMESAIRKSFSDWKRGSEPVANVPKPASKRSIYIIDRPGAPQSTIYLGLGVADPTAGDYKALLVTDALLGGSFASRITTNIREQKGYTYSPRSSVSSRFHDSYWTQFASVTTAVTGASLKEIFYEIDRLQKSPPPADELKGIQNYLAGIFVLRNSSPGGIIGQLSFLDLQGLPESYLTNYVKDLHAVTPEQVQETARKYLRMEDMIIVIAGDRKQIAKQVAPFGKVVG